ncbi:hypothetical protein ACS0TY_025689 [Phlomoides rotata]
MEGLIPMVYRSLKKSKTRRKYECLSSTAAQTYNIADFYIKDDVDHDHDYFSRKQYLKTVPDKVSSDLHHRRHNSEVPVGGFAMEEVAAKKQQLVRFRSHRMFSCVTGV